MEIDDEVKARAIREVHAKHARSGTAGDIFWAIDLAVAQDQLSPEFVKALTARVGVLAIQNAPVGTIFDGFESDVREQVENREGGGSSLCCKP